MSLPRYPEYKDSGLVWLGMVPTHWKVSVLRRIIKSIESGVSVNATDTPATVGELGVLKTSCVYTGEFDPNENKVVVAEETGRVACPVTAGTLIVSRMNTPDLVGAAGFVRNGCDYLFLPDRLWQVHFKDADAAFVHYWTKDPSYRAQVHSACAGTSSSMQNLSQDEFRSFSLPIPPVTEQAAIITFLDRETAKIDTLIAEQEKLLTLLAEKRQATISHAVTKGLDPNVPMKDSGVAWLGEVPAHWDTMRLKNLATIQNGCDYKHVQTEGDGYPVIGSGGEFACASEYLYDGESVLLGRKGTIDRPLYIKGAFWPVDTMFYTKIKPETCGKYLYYCTLNIKFDLYATSTALPSMTQADLSNIHFAVPAFNEQTAIAAFLDSETTKLDALKAEATRAIDLLKERRSALISAAVTGKIDVHGSIE